FQGCKAMPRPFGFLMKILLVLALLGAPVLAASARAGGSGHSSHSSSHSSSSSGHSSSSSSSSGSSSSSSGGAGDASDWIFFVGFFGIFGGVFVMIFVVFFSSRRRPRVLKTPRARPDGWTEFLKRDPGFDRDAFLKKASTAFVAIQNAWSAQD